jgi:pimeloyl-ACP methyl ester carboxylesterase
VTSPTIPGNETVASTDGVAVAVHHLAPGPPDSPLLLSHATGFHARAYRPVAAALADAFDGWGHDARGHGSTPAPPDWNADWRRFGDDATAVARWLVDRSGTEGQLVGFGHSMGGATLLMAAHRHPGMFRALVLFEPIVPPPDVGDHDPEESPLVQGARRRRRGFASYQDAIDNFRSKPPMESFDAQALEEYVRGGFRPVDADDPEGPVELTCDPQVEAATFANSRGSGLWSLLSSMSTPTLVVGGRTDEGDPPALFAEPIADALRNGRYLLSHLDHFGPFVDPVAVAGMVRDFAA